MCRNSGVLGAEARRREVVRGRGNGLHAGSRRLGRQRRARRGVRVPLEPGRRLGVVLARRSVTTLAKGRSLGVDHRMVDDARRALRLAREEARTLGHRELDAGHLLLGPARMLEEGSTARGVEALRRLLRGGRSRRPRKDARDGLIRAEGRRECRAARRPTRGARPAAHGEAGRGSRADPGRYGASAAWHVLRAREGSGRGSAGSRGPGRAPRPH